MRMSLVDTTLPEGLSPGGDTLTMYGRKQQQGEPGILRPCLIPLERDTKSLHQH